MNNKCNKKKKERPLCVKCAFVDSRSKRKKKEKKKVEVRTTELDPRHRAMLGNNRQSFLHFIDLLIIAKHVPTTVLSI